MASISTDRSGSRAVQFIAGDRKRRTVRLGRVTMKTANEVRLKIEALNSAKVSGMSLDNDTARWLDEIGDDLAAKLAAVGLIGKRNSATLDGFIRTYMAGRTDVKPRTQINLEQCRRRLVEHFGTDRALREITAADADQFAIKLRGRYAEATTARTIKRARQFFTAARRARLLTENPFETVKPGAMDNADRLHFVDADRIAKILDACPNAKWRAIVALMRFGGLRCPSELLRLRWGDIDWERGRFLVHSPKLEHTKKGKRWVPLFPELRPHLEQLFEDADAGEEFIVAGGKNAAQILRKQFERIIEQAGLLPWPRLFQNLRSSRETELAARFPLHVVTAWIGNSAAIAAKHYLQTTDEDFENATKSAAQSGAVRSAFNGQALTGQKEHRSKTLRCQALATDVHSNQCLNVPRLGLEQESASSSADNDLCDPADSSAAQSGAVCAKSAPTLDLDALAAALVALPPDERARLAAMLAGKQN